MSHWTKFREKLKHAVTETAKGHTGHYISKGINHTFAVANHYGKKWFGNTEWHIGVNSTDDGKSWDIDPNNTYVNPWPVEPTPIEQPAPVTRKIPGQNEPGYSRNTAATAADIAQGGMTKDEIQQFNIKHPNETAQRG